MPRSGTSERRFLGRRGTTAVEFAGVAATFFGLLLGGFEVGRYCFAYESVNYLVGELARAAVVNPDAGWSSDEEKAKYVRRASILRREQLTTLNVNITRAAAPALTTVTVTAKYDYLPNYKPSNNGSGESFGAKFLKGFFRPIEATTTLRFVAP